MANQAMTAPKMGPVVKLTVLDIESGMKAIEEYCMYFEIIARNDLKKTMLIAFLGYFVRLKSTPRTSVPQVNEPIKVIP